MASELVLPFEQARNYHQGRVDQILFIVIHDGETQELPTSAEGMQHYFAGPDAPQASAHAAADDNSLVRSVHDWDTAWAAPGCNAMGLHLEQAGRASQKRINWLDPYSKKMIEEFSAKMVADWSVRHHIPLLKRGPSDILARRGGVVGHIDVTNAEKTAGGHTDPGTSYPYDLLLGAAREHVQNVPPVKVAHNPFPRPNVTFTKGCGDDRSALPHPTAPNWTKVAFVRWALGLPPGGHFGAAVFAAVIAFQRKHGLAADGIVGPDTIAALAVITHPA